MEESIVSHYRLNPERCQELEPVHRYNNFVKAALIQTYLKPCGQVLDMPCGKGGDLKKYRENRAGFYVGIDIVPERIEEAKKRHKTTKCMFGALFEVADFTKPLDLECSYDLVSCQFALHYAWDTAERAEQVLRNGADRLTSNGFFLLTFPDWTSITDRLFEMMESPDDHNWAKFKDNKHVYRIGGPRHYLEFESDKPFMDFMQELQTEPFGRRYIYYQQGAIHGIPEYMVDPYTLRDMCKALGLTVELDTNFIHFQKDQQLERLRSNMGAAKPLKREARDIVGLYRALVVTKGGQGDKKRMKQGL